MSSPMEWSRGRYEAVAERIAAIAGEVVSRTDDVSPLEGADVVDLACGTGSAALAAHERGAHVTGVDLTGELVSIAEGKARDAGADIAWITADASDTGLDTDSFDGVVSNMGIIFVDPDRQLAELARLLRPGGVLGFSAWVRATHNPFYDPIVSVLGRPAQTGPSPDQWGEHDTIHARLADDFQDVDVVTRTHTWEFESLESALTFISDESPMHVNVLHQINEMQHDRLMSAFEVALTRHVGSDGRVAFESPYVIVTARRQ
ncbi:class I SAM-dependent methyltransferase [Williamsia maris]|nr:class I SAM-dependent methyltransferase [Williamsia maris]